MHGKALINEALKGNPVERTPWVPYTGSQIANLKGYTAQEMFRDADKLYECCIEAESQYSPDGMTPMFDLQVEAEILGCDLAWYDNTPPTVCSHPLEGELVIPTRRIQKTDGRIPLILDVMRRFKAAKPDIAVPLYEKFMAECEGRGFHVEHGEFGADMQVFSQNDGPVTILFDTDHM